jgi:hypothetical protein
MGSSGVLPYLPNELKIRILSFIEDPHFLWITCRKVSRNFKQWSEELYSHNYLSNLRLHLHLTPRGYRTLQVQNVSWLHATTEYFFEKAEIVEGDSERIILHPQGLPWSTSTPLQGMRMGWTGQRADEFTLLADMSEFNVKLQVLAESALGLRPAGQNHVCPCRSLKDGIRRGHCERYVGAERFFDWNAEDCVLGLRWKDFLDYVHSRKCKTGKKQ